MKKTTTKSEQPIVTRAEKKDAVKNLLRELLTEKEYKHNDLIEEASNVYAQRFSGEDTENKNDVRGRIGSVIDIMKKEEELVFDGGRYALKVKAEAETPVKKETSVETETPVKTKAKRTTRAKKTEKAADESSGKASEPTPFNESEQTPGIEDVVKEKSAEETGSATTSVPKKRGRKPAAKTTDAAEEKKTRKTTKKAAVSNETPIVEPAQKIATEIKEAETPVKKEVSAENKTDEQVVLNVPNEKEKADEKREEKSVRAVEKSASVEQDETPIVEKTTKKAEQEEKSVETVALVPRAEKQVSNVVMDMSFLLDNRKSAEKQQPKSSNTTEKTTERKAESIKTANVPVGQSQSVRTQPALNTSSVKSENGKEVGHKTESMSKDMTEQAVSSVKTSEKTAEKASMKTEKIAKSAPSANITNPTNEKRRVRVEKMPTRTLTADEKLRDAFLKKIRSLGGDYFEYYSVYLLEKYSRKNGRRLEGLKITGGDKDGGIDGEIELTDRLGFKETIYIQSKNWNPEKGDERLWVVGETLLQQFIGACACRQAKEGKQHCRGIFITTSRFTPDAKRILETMSEKIVGYDGDDLYEAAKECEFGVVNKNGTWTLDEQLLSGERAFFRVF